MFAAKIEAPIASHPTDRPPRKKSVPVSCFRFVNITTAANRPKYPKMTNQSNPDNIEYLVSLLP